MKKLKLRGRDLIKMGFPKGPAVSLALEQAGRHRKFAQKEEVLAELSAVLRSPDGFRADEVWGTVAEKLEPGLLVFVEQALKDEPIPYKAFGEGGISLSARGQMDLAMRLPVVSAGALMPDAHHGYGLPIGGVWASENAVMPYGVGMDIGCRMSLSVYPLPPSFLEKNREKLQSLLLENTRFGKAAFDRPMDDEVLHHSLFREIPKLRSLQGKARLQIGTSGSGNHFVEFGVAELTEEDTQLGVPAGQYLGLLSHSGSRGMGAAIAQHYTQIAREVCLLPKEAAHLAWLDMESEAGQEYWLAMNLAGAYAAACHRQIHERISTALGEEPLGKIENHHNFAWKEVQADGQEWIVHRKGATPAGKGVLGIIPGSMTAPGFIVRGKGEASALSSAAHGAGRQLSRRKAKESIRPKAVKQHLAGHGVSLIGGGLDEAPFAYKDIYQVMAAQEGLVEVLGRFWPKVVRMDDGK